MFLFKGICSESWQFWFFLCSFQDFYVFCSSRDRYPPYLRLKHFPKHLIPHYKKGIVNWKSFIFHNLKSEIKPSPRHKLFLQKKCECLDSDLRTQKDLGRFQTCIWKLYISSLLKNSFYDFFSITFFLYLKIFHFPFKFKRRIFREKSSIFS